MKTTEENWVQKLNFVGGKRKTENVECAIVAVPKTASWRNKRKFFYCFSNKTVGYELY